MLKKFIMTPNLKQFLAKSTEFRTEIFRYINHIPFTEKNEKRILATLIMSDISSEHCLAIQHLAKMECFISIASLLRLQYESLLRATWLFWCASDDLVEKLHQPLTEQSVKVEKLIPTINLLLQDLKIVVENGKLPRKAFDLLNEFKVKHIKPVHSFVHSGMHAFNRKKEGYVEPMLIQLVQNSNGLDALNAMILATLIGDERTLMYIVQMQHLYLDCLPMHIPEIMKQHY